MTGLIWLIQLVHYPSFKSVDDNISSAIINFNIPFNDISDYINPGVGIRLRHQIDLSNGN